MLTKRFYSPKEAAEILCVSEITIRRKIKQRKLAIHQEGKHGSIKIPIDSIERYIKSFLTDDILKKAA